MAKRKNFVFASFFLALVYLLTRFLWSAWEWRSWGMVLISLASFFIVFFLFHRETVSLKKTITVAILPSFFVLSLSLFSPLITSHWWQEGGLMIVLAGGFYLLLLVENVFVVSLTFKTVPLYRAASATGFLFTLLVGFFLFNTVFSLKFSPWINGLLTLIVSWPLFYHLFWSAAISEAEEKEIGVYTGIASWLLAQLAIAVSFWPAGVGLSSLYLVSLVYLLGGIIQAEIKGRLFRKTLWEYIWVGLATFVALFFSLGW